ncbi:MAG: COX15/CtaA family protein [Proteobacteria bacterium]|nr:COX15/CtaA family protein [Pseudomonadota bacterium]
MTQPNTQPSNVQTSPAVALWLGGVAVLVFGMVVVGGITRLTDSGLSMVEWRPLMGAFPPITDSEWQRLFALYQQSPEGRLINPNLSLAGFKWIFFWEYMHRLLGRVIGLVYAVPMLWFAWRGELATMHSHQPPHQHVRYRFRLPWRYGFIFLLGAAQGVIGWWMVKSGLVDVPEVAPYRLAVHLGLALLILALLIWGLCDCVYGSAPAPRLIPPSLPAIVFILLAITILAGGLVAGLGGGLVYNQYPLMGTGFIPPEYGFNGWRDPFTNPPTSQFHHRWLAAITAISIVCLAWRTWRVGLWGRGGVMVIAVACQFILGILAVLYAVPFHLAILHQAVAAVLLASVVWGCHGLAKHS